MPSNAAAQAGTIRFGITAVFLYDRLRMLGRWQSYLESAIGSRVQFIQRGTYSPIIDGLRAGQIDFAWICGYPYVLHARELRLVAVPSWRGRPLYQSYLIAGAQSAVAWGTAGDIPVPGDYVGSAADDYAVWRPSSGT